MGRRGVSPAVHKGRGLPAQVRAGRPSAPRARRSAARPGRTAPRRRDGRCGWACRGGSGRRCASGGWRLSRPWRRPDCASWRSGRATARRRCGSSRWSFGGLAGRRSAGASPGPTRRLGLGGGPGRGWVS
uniref:Uncharacterized protein n=1 Tax=Parastrongyloides trichosuri TaxID=131310 RepID=A0A0N4ZCU1_PARTI